MNQNLLEILKPTLKDRLLVDIDDRISYGFYGSFGQYVPDCVTQVISVVEVQSVVQAADKLEMPIYPRGASTSLSEGPLSVHGGKDNGGK